MTRTAQEPITRHLEIEALMEAVRWPGAEPTTTVILAGQLLAARRYQDGYEYFLERAEAAPDRPLFLAVAGYFQGRLGTDRDAALAKLDDAAERELGLPNYFRGLSLADLPDLAGRAETAAADLELVLAVRDRFPVGFLRGVRRALSEAYAALGRHDEAKAALEESGYVSGADVPLLTTDFWVTAETGSISRRPGWWNRPRGCTWPRASTSPTSPSSTPAKGSWPSTPGATRHMPGRR